ncbi:methyl-accepting chemotaxis protein [Salinibacter ruber]|uniref:methyl-accepting chemotaxis protein n=1 Tax=Salinibacter ruber TaxID=146919 RepID=UPI0013C2C833|nr:methyl-accepting chemotaxis protein [Salinibacter ruber]
MFTSLTSKVVARIAGTVTVAFVLAFAVTFYFVDQNLKEEARSKVWETARKEANAFNTRQQRLRSSTDELAGLLAATDNPSRRTINKQLRSVAEQRQITGGVGAVIDPEKFERRGPAATEMEKLTDSAGRFAPYWVRGDEELFVKIFEDIDKSWYKIPENEGRSYITDPYTFDGVLRVSYSAPVKSEGNVQGVVMTEVTLTDIQKQVGKVELYDTGYAMLVSNSGRVVAAPGEKHAGRSQLSEIGDHSSLEALQAAVENGQSKQVEIQDPFTGTTAVASVAPVPTSDWSMITVAPTDEMMADVYFIQWVMIAIGLFALLLVGGVAALISRRLTKPIVSLSEAAEAVTGGDRSVEVAIDRNDELGSLGTNFNQMVGKIRESIQEVQEKSKEATSAAEAAEEAQQEAEAQQEYLSRKVQEMLDAMDRFADGDLTVRVQAGRDDEIGKLFDGFNRAVEGVRQAFTKVRGASEKTVSAAGQISASSEQMAASAEEQSAQAEEVAAAVEQLNQTIGENARSVQQVAEAAGDGSQQAQEGQQVVAEATGKMEEEVQGTAETIERLQASSEEISQVVETIDDIAGQTNLLALNAAIEASRAGSESGSGDTGQGFGVVAEEVRQLAEETDQATTEIAEIIGEVQTEIQEAVEAARQSSANAEEGIELSREASAVLDEIVGSISRVEQMTDEIAAASEEQSTTSEEIARSVQSISTAAQESAAGVTEVSDTADRLERLSAELEDSLDQFRMERDQSAPHEDRPETGAHEEEALANRPDRSNGTSGDGVPKNANLKNENH